MAVEGASMNQNTPARGYLCNTAHKGRMNPNAPIYLACLLICIASYWGLFLLAAAIWK